MARSREDLVKWCLKKAEEYLECFYCKGSMVRGKMNYTLSRQGFHLLIDEVPVWICLQCGEVYSEGDEVDAVQDLIETLDSKIVKANLVKQTCHLYE